MYIIPNTNLKIYSGLPLDNSYNHTLYFSDIQAQTNFFHNGRAKFTNANFSYVKPNQGQLKVEINAERLYDCNYLAFQNNSFGTKWFYCFINNIEYINNTTSLIHFQIDVIQTYMFDITFEECFIERQHSKTDAIGDNIVEENLPTGEYITAIDKPTMLPEWSVVMLTGVEKVDNDYQTVRGSMVSGIYSGLKANVYSVINAFDEVKDLTQLNNDIEALLKDNKQDSIVSIFMFPSRLINFEDPSKVREITLSINKGEVNGKFDSYEPKNNKLYTSPYNLICVECTDGQNIILEPQFMKMVNNADYHITLIGAINGASEILVYPNNYKGIEDNYGCGFTITSFPLCSVTIDSYRAWVASGGQRQLRLDTARNITNSVFNTGKNTLNNGTASAKNTISDIASVSATGVSPSEVVNLVGEIGNIGFDVAQYSLTEAIQKNLPPTTKGLTTGTALAAKHKLGVRIQRRHITKQYAQMVDNYFTKFGYAQNIIAKPNFNARQRFTYIKTGGCSVYGRCPSDDIKLICDIHDKGITYWKNADDVGNYHSDNKPI